MTSLTNSLKLLWGQPTNEPIESQHMGTINTIEFLESALALANFIKIKKLSEERWEVA